MESIDWTPLIGLYIKVEQPSNNTGTSSKTLEDFNAEESSRRLAVLIYLCVLCAVGTVGNSMVIIIYPLRFPRTTHRTFIAGIAVVDLIVCVLTIPFEIVEIRHQYTFYNEAACKIFRSFGVWLSLVSMFLLMGMSYEKFRRICKPFQKQMTVRSCRVYIMCVMAILLVLVWPSMLQSGIRLVNLGNNITGHDCSLSDKYADTLLPTISEGSLLLVTIICIITLIVLYSLIGRTIFVHNRFRKQFRVTRQETVTERRRTEIFSVEGEDSKGTELSLPGSQLQNNDPKSFKDNRHSTRKVTKIAFVVSMVFILGYIPHMVISLLTAIKGKFLLPPGPVVSAVLPIIARSFIINNIANPIIYGFLDVRFRMECKLLFFKLICCRNKN